MDGNGFLWVLYNRLPVTTAAAHVAHSFMSMVYGPWCFGIVDTPRVESVAVPLGDNRDSRGPPL